MEAQDLLEVIFYLLPAPENAGDRKVWSEHIKALKKTNLAQFKTRA